MEYTANNAHLEQLKLKHIQHNAIIYQYSAKVFINIYKANNNAV